MVPMPTGERPFAEIAIDFVDKLPESKGFHAILVVRNRFTKVQPYLPAKTSRTAADGASEYINEIWQLHGLPIHITSDRGPQFASKFSKELNRKVHINLRLSTAYLPWTDGLCERAVQTLKQYLRFYCHDRQNHWRAWLPLSEFSYNITSTTTHNYSPHPKLYAFDPRTIHVYNENKLCSPAVEEWLN